MKYKKEKRLDIGAQVYEKKITKLDAMVKYDISDTTVENYVKEYKEENNIPIPRRSDLPTVSLLNDEENNLELYQSMTKEELIRELIISKANELRAKKGYEVKGVGQKKEFVSLNNKNSK